MQNRQRIVLFEAALRMELAVRCQRAYLHDLKNGLHAIHSAVEVLIRAISVGSDKPERITTFAKSAVTQHSTAIESLFSAMIAADSPPVQLDINTLIQKCVSFLRHDAAEHSVKIELQLTAIHVEASMTKMRLVLLALITDAIDALAGGGKILITTHVQDKEVVIDIRDSRSMDKEVSWSNNLPDPDLEALPLRAALLPPVIQHLIAAEGGRVEQHLNAPGQLIRIAFPNTALLSI